MIIKTTGRQLSVGKQIFSKIITVIMVIKKGHMN